MQWKLNYAIYLLATFSHTSMAKLNNYLESCIIIRDFLLVPCKKMCFSQDSDIKTIIIFIRLECTTDSTTIRAIHAYKHRRHILST